MLAWIIVLVALMLLLILPLGVNVLFQRQVLCLKLKIGPLKLQILPAKGKQEKEEKPPKEPKPKKEKVKVPKNQKKLKLTRDDIFSLLKIVFRALHRFRKHLSIDRLKIYLAFASEDPYDAVVQFGAANAGLSTLMPFAHDVLKIRDEDIRTTVDFKQQKMQIDAEVTATLQLWEILFVVSCAAASVLVWYLKKKKPERTAAKAAEQKGAE